MHVTYLVVTTLAVLMTGYAAASSLLGAESVKAVADRLQIPRRWMLPFGVVLGSGAVGLGWGWWSRCSAQPRRSGSPCTSSAL
jgi:hypothetical protein